MNLFENLTSSLLGNFLKPEHKQLLNWATEFLNSQGGVQGLMGKFESKGLGNIFQSWVSTGQNLPISASQLQTVLGQDFFKTIATKLGQPEANVQGMVTEWLPKIVDGLTPNGSAPATTNFDVSQLISLGTQLLKK